VIKNFAQILDRVQEGLAYCTYATPTKGNKMEDFYYEAYLDEYADKSDKAIKGRRLAIMNRIHKSHNWQESLTRGHFNDALACVRALDYLLENRKLA
jgi:hypothetical protein